MASGCSDTSNADGGDEVAPTEGGESADASSDDEIGSDDQTTSGDSSSGSSETTTTTTSESESESEVESSESADDSGPKFDTLGEETGTDTGGGCGGEGNGELEFSYIWIANSPQGTVSKIDTQTIVEEGRYQVRPQGGGSPSRTSVSLRGDVVVASRDGGVTKIHARPEDCVDDNGTPGIQSSTGKFDVLAWGEEECVAWYSDFDFVSERAIAWTPGEFDDVTCEYENAKVWVGATNDQSNLDVLRLDGDTGAVEDQFQIPGTQGSMNRSPYGAAVDIDGNLWMVNAYCGGSLIYVDGEDLSYEIIPPPQQVCPYGITVDSQGYVWIGGYQTWTGRYDPVGGNWDLVQAQGLGIQEDGEGRLWLGAYQQDGVYAIDGETLQVLGYWNIPSSGQTKGVAVDFDGFIWVVSDAGNLAARFDPDTLEVQTYDGLDSPYSYSDMTGWGLNIAAVVPQG